MGLRPLALISVITLLMRPSKVNSVTLCSVSLKGKRSGGDPVESVDTNFEESGDMPSRSRPRTTRTSYRYVFGPPT